MALKKSHPGCGAGGDCACESVACLVRSDGIDYADGTSPASVGWSSGGAFWTIAGGKLVCSSSSRTITGSATAERVQAVVRSSASGDCLQVRSRGIIGELEVGTGKIRIRASGSVQRECDVVAAVDTDYTLMLSLDDDRTGFAGLDESIATVFLDGIPYASIMLDEANFSGTIAQLATGTITGTAEFDDFLSSRTDWSGDATCPRYADCCWPAGDYPDQIQVVLAGWAGAGAGCGALDGSYVLDRLLSPPLLTGTVYVCTQYELEIPAVVCGGVTLTALVLTVVGRIITDGIARCVVKFWLRNADDSSRATTIDVLFGATGGSVTGGCPGASIVFIGSGGSSATATPL